MFSAEEFYRNRNSGTMVNYGIERREAIWNTTQAIEKQNQCYFSHIGTFLYEDGEKLRFLVQERTAYLNAHVSTSYLEQLVKLTLMKQEE